MRRPILLLLILTAALGLGSRYPVAQVAAPAPAPAVTLTALDAFILGVVEGVTEFLPVSSTGHLIITNALLGLDDDAPLIDVDGAPRWFVEPTTENPAGVPLTVKLAADTFAIVIQGGAIAAVIILYWKRLLDILFGLLGRNRRGLLLLRNIIIAVFPAAALGLTFGGWIDDNLFSVGAVAAALFVGAFLMLGAEAWRKRRDAVSPPDPKLDAADLSPLQALVVGGMQCLALWPGTSRSMVTIVGGYLAGLSPARAAEFSFLIGLPTLTGAAFLKSYKAGPAMIDVLGWPNVLFGSVVAAIAAAISVRWLVSYLSRHGLGLFAGYRIVLALLLAWYFRAEIFG